VRVLQQETRCEPGPFARDRAKRHRRGAQNPYLVPRSSGRLVHSRRLQICHLPARPRGLVFPHPGCPGVRVSGCPGFPSSRVSGFPVIPGAWAGRRGGVCGPDAPHFTAYARAGPPSARSAVPSSWVLRGGWGLLHDWPNVPNGGIRDGWDLLLPGRSAAWSRILVLWDTGLIATNASNSTGVASPASCQPLGCAGLKCVVSGALEPLVIKSWMSGLPCPRCGSRWPPCRDHGSLPANNAVNNP
jgi:hypothetical protein